MEHFPSPADWRDQVVYQIFTDRFDNGDPTLDFAHPEACIDRIHPKGLRGGDFAGIARRLDYIKGLGATAIWISPVFLNDAGSTYHGYCTVDFSIISPHLGGLAGLRQLIDAAHERGMYVLIDIVCNHLARRITSSHPEFPRFRGPPRAYRMRWIDPKRKYPPPFHRLDSFHNHGSLERYEGDQLVLGSLHGLDDLRTESPRIRRFLCDTYKTLIDETDCDGFRVDTVRHVEWEFWADFCKEIRSHASSLGKRRFFLTGEVLDAKEGMVAQYLGRCRPFGSEATTAQPAYLMDSVTDYPLYFALRDVFLRNAPPLLLRQRWLRLREPPYDQGQRDHLLTFLDNHDVPRFLWRRYRSCSRREREQRLRLALTFLLTTPGIPCIYAGTEQGFHGGPDPANREEMRGHFHPQHPLYQFIVRLTDLRRRLPGLRRGGATCVQAESSGPGIIAYVRGESTHQILIVVNTSTTRRPLRTDRISQLIGSQFVDVLGAGGKRLRIDQDYRLEPGMIPPLSARIYVPAAIAASVAI